MLLTRGFMTRGDCWQFLIQRQRLCHGQRSARAQEKPLRLGSAHPTTIFLLSRSDEDDDDETDDNQEIILVVSFLGNFWLFARGCCV